MNGLNIGIKSLVFNYQHDDFEKSVQKFNTYVNTKTLTRQVAYPNDVAVGYEKTNLIEPGFSYRFADCTLAADVDYTKTPAPTHFNLLVHFCELNFEQKIFCKTGNTIIESNDHFYSAAIMTNSFTEQQLQLKKGTAVRAISVQLSENWLKNNITGLTPEKLALIKEKDCLINFISTKQRQLLYEIFNNSASANMPALFIKARVLSLTEEFMNALCDKNLGEAINQNLQKDIQALMHIEDILLKKYNEEFPSIEVLAKTAYMSVSKLKKLFKKTYGVAIYQYYQKNRMRKAQEILKGQTHSISQVGALLGYQNMSNFSAAFKKEFNYLPSEFLQII